MRRLAAVVMGLCLAVGAVALAAVALPLSQYRTGSGTDLAMETVSAVERQSDLAVNGSVRLSWSTARVFRAGATSGLVTAVTARPGEGVDCGDPVLEVDGVQLWAYCGPRPLWRDISAGTRGSDRDELVEFLSVAGLLEEVPAEATNSEVGDAIAHLHGAAGSAASKIASPGEFVWIGDGAATPTGVAVEAGQTLSGGDPVLVIDAALTEATVDSADSATDTGERVFGVDRSSERFDVVDGRISDVAGLSAVLEQQGLLAEGLPDVATGSTRLRDPIEMITVPATAVLSGSGDVCVLVVDGDGTRSVSVVPQSASVGTVFVIGDITAGDAVVVNPDRAQGC